MAFPHLRVLTVFLLVIFLQSVTAKRGCSAFGHSCFGGHGKRSGGIPAANGVLGSEAFDPQQRQLAQEKTPPLPDYPNSEFLAAGDNIIPIRDGGFYENYDHAPVKEMLKYRLKNIVKRWMESYKKSERAPDYGFIVD